MKVILLRDVAKIGKRFSIVEVPDGFALNKLIPAKDAEAATAANVKRVLERNKQTADGVAGELEQIKVISGRFAEQTPLKIMMDANAKEHLFQSVHILDIVKAAKGEGVNIPESYLTIENPIKSLGLHTVLLTVGATQLPLQVLVVAK